MLDNEIIDGAEGTEVEGSDAPEVTDQVEGNEGEVVDGEGLADTAEEMAKQMSGAGDPKAAPKKDEKPANKEIKEQIRKFKLKIDGKEEELDEQEVLKRAQIASAAQKRMNEAAQLRKDVEQLVEMLRTNPLAVLADPALGLDVKKLFEDYANQQLEEESKSPEQREKEKLQKELEDLKKQAQTEKEAREKAEFERLKEKASQDLDNQMTAALETAGLPQNPYVIKRMADYMMLALQNDKEVSPNDIIPIVKKEIYGDFKQFLAISPDEVLEELLTKERINNLRKKALAAAKRPVETANSVKSTTQPTNEEKEKTSSNKKQTIASWLRS